MITENTLRVKIEGVADGSLKATLDGTAQSVEKIDKAQQGQAESAAAVAAASQASAAATQAVGESVEEATARIKAMVQASLERQQAEQAQITSSMRGVDATKVVTQTINEQVAAQQRAIAATDAYRQRSAAASKATGDTSGIDAQRDALHKLLGEIDPTIAKLDKLDQQQAQLAGFKKAGLLSDDDFQRFNTAIDGSRTRIASTGEALEHFTLNTATTRREFGYLIKDLATGQWGRAQQEVATLASNTGIMGAAFGAAGLTIAAAVGFVAAFGAGALEAYNNEQKLNEAVATTGNFAGVTMGQVNNLAGSLGTATGKASLARDILLALAADGKVGQESYAALGQAAFDMAELTGRSAEQAASSVTSMFDGTAAGALKANEQYHFLTDATYDQIKALEEEGKQQEAVRVTAEAFTASMGPRLDDLSTKVYGLAKAWDHVSTATHNWWEEFKAGAALIAGTADISQQYYAQLGLVNDETKLWGHASFGQQDKLNDLKRQLDEQTQQVEDQLAANRRNDDATTASGNIDRLAASVDKTTAKKRDLDELSASFEKLWGSASPDNQRLAGVQRIVNADGSVGFAGGDYDKLKADIDKKYAVKDPRAKRDPEVSAYQTFSNQVDALGVKNITADNSALTQYEQGVAKLADEMGVYMAKGGDASKAADLFNRGQQALQKTLEANHAAEMDAEREYAAALDKRNAALQLSVNAEIARIGMGDKEYQRSQEITKQYRDEADALAQLAIKRQMGVDGKSGGISQEQFEFDTAKVKSSTAEAVAILKSGYIEVDAAQADWSNGLSESLQNYVDKAADVAGQTRDLFTNAFDGMGDSLANFVTTGKGNFSGLIDSIIADLIKMEARILVSQVLQSVLGAFMPSYGAGSTNTFSSIGTDASGGSINFVSQVGGRAEGGPIRGAGTGTSDSIPIMASNGEYMQTADAHAYYGTAFMDAIRAKRLPRFASGGAMGTTYGGSGIGQPAPQIIVNNHSDSSVKASSQQQPDGRWISTLIIDTVSGNIASGGKAAKAMEGRYGLSRRGVPVSG